MASCFLMLCAASIAAVAQRSTTLMQGDPKSQYEVLKRTYKRLYHSDVKSWKKGDALDLMDCGSDEDDANNETHYLDSNPIIPALTSVARRAVEIEKDLAAAGYPETIWRPTLTEYENAELIDYIRNPRPSDNDNNNNTEVDSQSGDDDIFQPTRLASILNNYREHFNQSLHPIVVEGGCGAGDFEIMITTVPPNGRVFFIPQFFYKLCEVQNVMPTDMERCDRWHEAFEGKISLFSGEYRYKAMWPDGTAISGHVNFDNLMGAFSGDRVALFRKQANPTVALKKP